MTGTERALAVAGGILGGLLAFTIGMPVALHVEKVLQDRARRKIDGHAQFQPPPREFWDRKRVEAKSLFTLQEVADEFGIDLDGAA
jgi:hypothetical protein